MRKPSEGGKPTDDRKPIDGRKPIGGRKPTDDRKPTGGAKTPDRRNPHAPIIKIKYEDERLIVIEKPSGLLSMSTGRADRGGGCGSNFGGRADRGEFTGRGGFADRGEFTGRGGRNQSYTDSVETTAYSQLTALRGRIFIVHRLDRDTSGIMVFAKDEEMKRMLQDSWDELVLERRYIAVLEGIPSQTEGTVTSWLSDNPKSMKVHSSPHDDGGRKAITHYTVKDSVRGINVGRWQMNYSLVEFELETGRKNQIRVHAADIGHPVAGDRKYGALTNPAGRLCLHARNLVIRHPVTGRTLSFSSAIPVNFRTIFRDESKQ